MSRRPGRPTRAEAEALGEHIREVAVAAFLEHGYQGASMEAIARAAGTTKQTLYSQYPDKRALFIRVIPWALSRHRSRRDPVEPCEGADLAEALTAIARDSLTSSTDPQLLLLQRIAMNEAAKFPEFAMSAETMMWSSRLRSVMTVLRRHRDRGEVYIDDDEFELAAEHFLALVEALPYRLAEFGIFRGNVEAERHLRYAVNLFIRAVTNPDRDPVGTPSTLVPKRSRNKQSTASR